LIAIPAIAGASLLKIIDLVTSNASVDWFAMAMGSVIAGVSAFLCIKLFLNLIDSIGFLPFILYRLALGAVLFLTILY
jgi:undecaprenyl-diphosphatase